MIDYEKLARKAGWIAEIEFNGEDDGVRSENGENWVETWESACKQDGLVTKAIRELNDQLRSDLMRGGTGGGPAGQILLTPGIVGMSEEQRLEALLRVVAYDDFEESNDPHGEHDFGSFEVDGKRIMWKIDYYDDALEWGSPDPSDPKVTTRVLTIFLAEEY